jgi:putative DNA methylase
MSDFPRLIEHAFPLKQTSLDSVHEKNVRHGHISTLHIWPARRPLAACRAALIATLLPDPSAGPRPEGMTEEQWKEEIKRRRQALCEKIGGRVVKKRDHRKMPNGQIVEREKEGTEGGILHWLGTEPVSGGKKKRKEHQLRAAEIQKDLEWFRQEIRKAYGGRAPRFLDPFAGGGAIPLEAMRLGCEATAVDINPVAWFILKCTLEYPQKLAGQTHSLPDFILEDEEFMDAFYKAHLHLVGRTKKTKKQIAQENDVFPEWVKEDSGRVPKADLAWHVRAWGRWVLNQARRELAQYYPVYADFEPIDRDHPNPYEKQPMRLVPPTEDGLSDVDSLNAEFSAEYLADKRNPRWVAKPTVAYLWARTVTCKNCRATIPLLKTRWLCKKDRKRVLLQMEPNRDRTGVVFGIKATVPVKGGNAAQRREHDKRLGSGTMSRSGARCPCCGTIMTMEDIRLEGKAGRLGAVNTAVVVEGQNGKEYRAPTSNEKEQAQNAESDISQLFEQIPFGLPTEPLPSKEALGFRVPLYGFDQWNKLFSRRQLIALGTFVKCTREANKDLGTSYDPIWVEALTAYLACVVSRTSDYMGGLCVWENGAEEVKHVFMRWALPITWDMAEGNPLAPVERFYNGGLKSAVSALIKLHEGSWTDTHSPTATNISALSPGVSGIDVIVTDPPYYDAIPYSDLMDFFYVWLRRTLNGVSRALDHAFRSPLSPKWNYEKADGELIDDASRHGGDKTKSKSVYEEGMFHAFEACLRALREDGRLVIVFAHKHPDAWETLVSAMIRAGFVVDGSWPIMTEMRGGIRNLGRASLASSVWLVCKKRPETARPGWDKQVLEDMRRNIREKLRDFWDAGIRGPDFVWAATGPALEAYSRHPVVKKANEPGQVMAVSEFLTHVRRMVVDFVVGRVLSGNGLGSSQEELETRGETGAASDDMDIAGRDRLDEPTAYYLLHRHDFGMDEAPAGACILYAVSCGLSDRELAGTWDLIGFTRGKVAEADDEGDEEADADAEADPDGEDDAGSKVKLKTWAQRKGRSLGQEAPGGKPVPLIDRVHCLMHLWKAGNLPKVDEYLDDNGLRRQELFKRLLQSLIELSPRGSEERSLLESISNHIQARGATKEDRQRSLFPNDPTEESNHGETPLETLA